MYAPGCEGDQELVRQHQERLLEQQRRLEKLKALPGKAAQPAQPVAPAYTRGFPIQGAESLSVSERGRLLKPYLGQCLGVRQLNELLKVITDHYIDKGLVNRPAILFKRNA